NTRTQPRTVPRSQPNTHTHTHTQTHTHTHTQTPIHPPTHIHTHFSVEVRTEVKKRQMYMMTIPINITLSFFLRPAAVFPPLTLSLPKCVTLSSCRGRVRE